MAKAAHQSWAYRGGVLMRVLAAVPGGYALAAAFIAALTLAWPQQKLDAAIGATMSAFLVWALAALWVFAARNALLAWLGVALPAAVLAAAAWLLKSGAL